MSKMIEIKKKVSDGVRLSDADAIALFESSDLLEIGALAETVNQRINQDSVFYNINTHINPTNICVMSCKFCSFARKPGDSGAYAYSNDEILEQARYAVKGGARELHIVGGLHPRWSLLHYQKMLRSIKEEFPQLHLKGFTAVEIDWLSKKSRKSYRETLRSLKSSGLGSMPGGGAEIFHPDCREKITAKLSTKSWLDIHRIAHGEGLFTNCTMLYGHVETFEHRVYHLRKLRDLQDETGGFNCFIPLSFQPQNNEMGIDRYNFGVDDLKTLSIARLYLDNFRHIKSYWVMLGHEIAQLGLLFGANDIDGTVKNEKIANMAGSRSGTGTSHDFIKNIIWKTGKKSQERDTLYNKIGESEYHLPAYERNVDCKSILRKFDVDGDVNFSSGELELVAGSSDFYDLSKLAYKIAYNGKSKDVSCFSAERINWCIDNLPSPSTLNEKVPHLLELGVLSSENINEKSFDELIHYVSSVKEKNLELEVSGLRNLWHIAQARRLTFKELALSLCKSGVKIISSSVYECEDDLTTSEVLDFHRFIYEAGLNSIANIHIKAPISGGHILWGSYIKRMIAIKQLSLQTGSIKGVCVIPSFDSWISPYDYFRAISVARLITKNINIIAPMAVLPTSKELFFQSPQIEKPFFRGQEKYVPLSFLVGANDAGWVPRVDIIQKSFSDEIKAVGFKLSKRNILFEPIKKHSPKEKLSYLGQKFVSDFNAERVSV